MSWLSSAAHGIDHAIHNIPVVGKMLPSSRGMLGATLGPIGYVAGNQLDHGSIMDDVKKGATNAGLIMGGLGAGGGVGGALAGAAGKLFGDGSGGLNIGNLVDAGLGTAGAINAANLQNKSSQFADNAMNTTNQSYDARAPLRSAGIAGMLHPTPSVNLGPLQTLSQRNNPFAKGGIQLGNVPQVPPTAPGPSATTNAPSQFATS